MYVYFVLCCALVGLDWVEPMLNLYLHVTCSCIHTFNSIYFDISVVWYSSVSCVMALKRKSTPSQNPLHSGASSFSSPVDPTPSHVQFRDEKAKLDFFENFSRSGIHLER